MEKDGTRFWDDTNVLLWNDFDDVEDLSMTEDKYINEQFHSTSLHALLAMICTSLPFTPLAEKQRM